MDASHGVRKGQRVRSLDGEDLGRVTRLYDSAFAVQKGFPILFRKDAVIRYDELRGVRDGALVVARSNRDLLELAGGEIPSSWRVPVPYGFPSAATPGEARGVFDAVASWPVVGVRPGGAADDPLAQDERAAEVEGRGSRPSHIGQRDDADRHAP